MNYVVDELRNIITLIAIELILTIPFTQKRKYYFLRLIGGIAVCLAATALYLPIRSFIVSQGYGVAVITVSVVWYMGIICLTGGLMAFCHKMNKTELIWILITAYSAQHFIYVTAVEIMFFAVLGRVKDVWGQLGLSVAFAAAIYTAMYFLFIPKGGSNKRLNLQNDWRNFSVLCVFFVIFFGSTFVNQSNARREGINYLSMISDLVNCLLVVAVQYVSQRNARMRYEKEALAKSLENEKRRYEVFKNSVDYINIKCHDLKHEINAMRSSGQFRTERLDEIAESIAVYESFADTGNKILDTLLTDVNFLCLNNGISFSCMADASGFSAMKNEDVYCLFRNMLDNAVEYIKTVEDDEKKFIRLFVKNNGNMKVIHQENYFEGGLSLADGLPKTTKPDKFNHGFGMKSMRRIAKKYGGDMRVTAENNLFKIDIVLP